MQSADGTKATFNSDKGVGVLQLLKEMRFIDNSMTKQQLFTQADTLQLLATNKVAMVVMAPDQLNTLKSQYQANLEDFGIGPMPQNGGNAALTGGNIFIFNPKSTADVIKAAFDYVVYSNFNLDVLENNLATQAAAGQVVGAPTNVLFTGSFQQQVVALNAKYANVPLQNYTSFVNSTADSAGQSIRKGATIAVPGMYWIFHSTLAIPWCWQGARSPCKLSFQLRLPMRYQSCALLDEGLFSFAFLVL